MRAFEIGEWERQRNQSVRNKLGRLVYLGLKGEATLRLWKFDGVEITQRDPLVLD